MGGLVGTGDSDLVLGLTIHTYVQNIDHPLKNIGVLIKSTLRNFDKQLHLKRKYNQLSSRHIYSERVKVAQHIYLTFR